MGGSGPLPPFDCEICGGTPSKKVSFVQFIGMFVAFQQSRYSHEVCQSCGLALGRKVQNRTLLTGWWGFVSFFANLYAILHNGIRLLQLGRLAAPTEGNPSARLDPGRSAFLRVGAIVPLAIVLVATGAILISMLRGQQVNGLVEGDCVSISTLGPSEKPVPCDGPHDGRIIAVTDTLEECPSRTDEAFAEESGKSAVLCVDTDTAGS
jgi:hypothetical protein